MADLQLLEKCAYFYELSQVVGRQAKCRRCKTIDLSVIWTNEINKGMGSLKTGEVVALLSGQVFL